MDKVLFDLIEQEYKRQRQGLELIASENFVSRAVMKAMGSVLTNKYAEGLPGKRYYGGCEVVDQVEQLAIQRAKELFGAAWVNVQPHSGAQANAAVMLAVLSPGDTLLGFDLSHGGHLTHGSPVNFSGKLYRAVCYGVDKESGTVSYEAMEEQAWKEKPKLIVCGASSYSRDWDYKRIRAIADEVGALVLADVSHPAGLIAKKLLQDPLPYCHIVTTTTHKTLRGPRGGIILMGKDFENTRGEKNNKGELKKMSQLLDAAVFPGIQGGPLEHVIAAKAVAFGEALSPPFTAYAQQVIVNARYMAKCFVEKGYKVISGGTDNHCMLIDLRSKHITGKQAENTLVKADITVNKNMVPFDTQSPFVTSGLRLGTSAITTRGVTLKEIPAIVDAIDRVLMHPDRDDVIRHVKQEVNAMMAGFELFDPHIEASLHSAGTPFIQA